MSIVRLWRISVLSILASSGVACGGVGGEPGEQSEQDVSQTTSALSGSPYATNKYGDDMAGFQRAKLILDNNSTVVKDITVVLTLGHSFEVAPTDPTTTSTTAALPGMPYARPFSIVPNTDQILHFPPGAHSATLTMDAAAIDAWHTCFDDKYAIDLDMVLDDDSHLTLTVDLF
jgi:hypothetical protein